MEAATEAAQPALPAPPAILSPRDSWTAGEVPMVSLANLVDASSYRLEVGENPDFKNPIEVRQLSKDSAEGPVRAFLNFPVAPGKKFFIRAKAVLSAGRETGWAIRPVLAVLPAPKGLPPELGPEALRSRRVTLSWTKVSAAAGYEVQVAREGDAGAPLQSLEVVDGGRTAIALPAPLPGSGKYLFRVRALAPGYQGGWAADAVFELPPLRPQIVGPAFGEQLRSSRPQFRWQPGEEEEEFYQLEIAPLTAAGSGPAHLLECRGTALQLEPPLERGARYQARIKAAHAPADRWSEAVQFEVLPDRPDPYRIAAVAADPKYHEIQPIPSSDGLRLVIFIRPAEDSRTGASALRHWQRALGAASHGVPGFHAVPREVTWGSPSHPQRLFHGAWSGAAGGPAALLVAAVEIQDRARPGGAVWRVEDWDPNPRRLLPSGFMLPIVRISLPGRAPASRLYFEARRLERGDEDGAGAVQVQPAVFTGWPAEPDSSNSAEEGEIWSANPDGTDLRLISKGRDPAISPDGNTLVFVTAGVDGPEMRLLFLNGRRGAAGAAKVFPSQRQPARALRGPSWSPRGDSIAFARDRGEGFDLAVVEVSTGREILITNSFGDDLEPMFLPDPSQASGHRGILFSSNRDGRSWNIYWADYQK
ncbi:MAG: PD40 domain-containing protein [Planctomycetes bacterium]|nr:PD40 domain-containing protein [Planctomycetota bacterium]